MKKYTNKYKHTRKQEETNTKNCRSIYKPKICKYKHKRKKINADTIRYKHNKQNMPNSISNNPTQNKVIYTYN